ncbi:MAG: Crp/Fnr family transcriptional regulator [Cloacibacillus evryensis]
MKKYLETIKKSPLFKGIEESEIEAMLGCLSVKARKYARHEFVMRFGDSTEAIGMVLSGSVHIVKEDFWGNRNIVTEIGPGQIFASYACTRRALTSASWPPRPPRLCL